MGVFYVALDLEYYFSNYMKWYNINNNWLHLFNGVAEYEYSTDVTNLRLKHTFQEILLIVELSIFVDFW